MKYVKNILFLCITVFCTKTQKCRQNNYLSKLLKYVNKGLFWCFPVFYSTKLRNPGKTHYLSKELKYVKKGLF
ncbi:hypothetical protein E2C01_085597 [Portunus trituberculatus]|uniref:Uncharacterized protein n=1 Tax=Portunus trituberculatus TaxID=210409 RepID=A0A5B7J361_PORTR|nr:hypothetical protein [Portunus trituberculatus]